ncbi:MAG TPA: holin [Polyangia bacterium]|jgi:hypothetical protein|nr:holin [Polyangia bacterium]
MAKAPVEKKVRAATAAATVVGVVVAVLNTFVADSKLLGALPPVAQAVVTLVGPPLLVFYAGWQARHTERATPPQP